MLNKVILIVCFFILSFNLSASTRIFNGKLVGENNSRWNFVVNVNKICTGSLIEKNWVLTAAHCVSRFQPGDERAKLLPINEQIVYFGKTLKDLKPMEVDRVIVHKHYVNDYDAKDNLKFFFLRPGEFMMENDLALMKLKNLSGVDPVKLYDKKDIYQKFGSTVSAAGWGFSSSGVYTEFLREADGKIKVYTDGMGVTNPDLTFEMEGLKTKNDFISSGDSGGPIVWNNGVVDYQIGVNTTGTSSHVGQATQVAMYYPWIQSYVNPSKTSVSNLRINGIEFSHLTHGLENNMLNFPIGYDESFDVSYSLGGGKNVKTKLEFDLDNVRRDSKFLSSKIPLEIKYDSSSNASGKVFVKVAEDLGSNYTLYIGANIYEVDDEGNKVNLLYSKSIKAFVKGVYTQEELDAKKAMASNQPPYAAIINNTDKPAPTHDPCNGQGQMPDGSCNASKYWKPGDKITFASWGPIGSNDKEPNDLLSSDVIPLKVSNDPNKSEWWTPSDPVLDYEYVGSVDGGRNFINYPNDFDSFRFYVHEKADVGISVGNWGITTPDAKMNVTTDDGYLIGNCSRSQWPIHSSYSLKNAKALGLAVYWNHCHIASAEPGYYRIWVTAKTPGRIPVGVTYMPHSAWAQLGRYKPKNDYYNRQYKARMAIKTTPPTNQTWIVEGVNGAYNSSWLTSVMSGIDD